MKEDKEIEEDGKRRREDNESSKADTFLPHLQRERCNAGTRALRWQADKLRNIVIEKCFNWIDVSVNQFH